SRRDPARGCASRARSFGDGSSRQARRHAPDASPPHRSRQAAPRDAGYGVAAGQALRQRPAALGESAIGLRPLARRTPHRHAENPHAARGGVTAMVAPFTIRIFVPDGDPEGVRIIDRMNWTGLGSVVPKKKWRDTRRRDEFWRPGVYILVG